MEIEFRGKRKDNNEWVYGYYVKYEHMGDVKHIIVTNWSQVYTNSHYVIPETVGMFTGLYDCTNLEKLSEKGIKIYSGDIVKHFYHKVDEESGDYKEYCKNYVIEWFSSASSHGYRCRNGRNSFPAKSGTVFNGKQKIIGNVHDNPELLKE